MVYAWKPDSGFGQAGGHGTRGTSTTSNPVTGSGLDSEEANAAIGLVVRATASIMTEVGAMTGLPRLARHAHIPI